MVEVLFAFFNYTPYYYNNNISFLKNVLRFIKNFLSNILNIMEAVEYKVFKRKPKAKLNFNINDFNPLTGLNIKTPKFLSKIYDFINPILDLVFFDIIVTSIFFLLIITFLISIYNSIIKIIKYITFFKKLKYINLDDFMCRYLLTIYQHFIVATIIYLNFTTVCAFSKEFFLQLLIILVFIKFLQLLFLPTKLLTNMGFFYIVYLRGSAVGRHIL